MNLHGYPVALTATTEISIFGRVQGDQKNNTNNQEWTKTGSKQPNYQPSTFATRAWTIAYAWDEYVQQEY